MASMQRAASSLCPRGGRWHAGGAPPYTLEALAAPMYRVCPPQNTSWHWHSPDPPCAVDHTSSWCSVLSGRSLLFIGDSLSMQMFLSFLFQVADRTELPAALPAEPEGAESAAELRALPRMVGCPQCCTNCWNALSSESTSTHIKRH